MDTPGPTGMDTSFPFRHFPGEIRNQIYCDLLEKAQHP